MKRITWIILLLVAATATAWYFRDPLGTRLAQLDHQYFPCRSPITYRIGSFDSRFGISIDDFRSRVDEAAQIWEQPAGKNLFNEQSSGAVRINLIYDYRQEATETLETLGITVQNDMAGYESLQETYDARTAAYQKDKAALEADAAAFEARQKAYETEVSDWNSRGGAPQDVYERLSREQTALKAEQTTLQQRTAAFNAQVDTLNALAVALNQLATTLNLKVAKYNQIGQQRGSEFEEGTYRNGPDGATIDVYEFRNTDSLVRLLAHELGHALGIGHVADEDAVMYRLNASTNATLTNDDLLALNQQCRIP